jgi:hypothetical protein
MGTDHDTQLGCLYIPPENMKYSRIESFDEIENELFVRRQYQIVNNTYVFASFGTDAFINSNA